MELQRSAGILLHITSLPGDYGIGDLGRSAYRFIEWLQSAKQKWWQVLPLGPVGARGEPYSALSSWAGAVEFLDLEDLARRGDLSPAELRAANVGQSERIHYPRVAAMRRRLVAAASQRFFERPRGREAAAYQRFCERERSWLDEWAYFSALKEVYRGRHWWEWEKPLALHDVKALRVFGKSHADRLRAAKYGQFRFAEQWQRLRERANSAGIGLIGDVAIYCQRDSHDVWANRDKFKLDKRGDLRGQSGVPPDYFSRSGQLWGTPVYDWAVHKAEGFAWWASRLRASLARVDLLRIDHFRGLEAYWEVPPRAKTARNGRWERGPGDAFFEGVRKRLGQAPFIAEDLGVITEEVTALRDRWGLPGMRVLQFAFAGGAKNDHLPHHYVPHSIVYTGTHDNDTTVGWFRKASKEERTMLRRYSRQADAPERILMNMAYASVAALAIVPMQDVLGLGSEARQNIPGSAVRGGNYRWKLTPRGLRESDAARLAELAGLYGRISSA